MVGFALSGRQRGEPVPLSFSHLQASGRAVGPSRESPDSGRAPLPRRRPVFAAGARTGPAAAHSEARGAVRPPREGAPREDR